MVPRLNSPARVFSGGGSSVFRGEKEQGRPAAATSNVDAVHSSVCPLSQRDDPLGALISPTRWGWLAPTPGFGFSALLPCDFVLWCQSLSPVRLCNTMTAALQAPVHGISQARIREWVAIFFSTFIFNVLFNLNTGQNIRSRETVGTSYASKRRVKLPH